MSTKARKPFVVRGFNVMSGDQFSCVGRMDGQVDFTEVTVDKQHNAVVELLTNSKIGSMSARKLTARNDTQTINGSTPDSDTVPEVYVLDLSIVMTVRTVADLRGIRSNLREVLKTWAEKSRVKGRRGWRANAIKTPTFEFDKNHDAVVVKTQAILSTAIFYSHDTATINVNFDRIMEEEDLRSLHRELSRVSHTQGYYSHLKYRHSVIGDGEII